MLLNANDDKGVLAVSRGQTVLDGDLKQTKADSVSQKSVQPAIVISAVLLPSKMV